MIGNPYKGFTPKDPILRDTVLVAIAAGPGGVGSATYTVPQGRGVVQAIEFACDNATLATVSQASFTLQGNKKDLISNENLLTYCPAYANRWAPFICELDENATVNINAKNASGTAINLVVTFLYYNPFVTAIIPQDFNPPQQK